GPLFRLCRLPATRRGAAQPVALPGARRTGRCRPYTTMRTTPPAWRSARCSPDLAPLRASTEESWFLSWAHFRHRRGAGCTRGPVRARRGDGTATGVCLSRLSTDVKLAGG